MSVVRDFDPSEDASHTIRTLVVTSPLHALVVTALLPGMVDSVLCVHFLDL